MGMSKSSASADKKKKIAVVVLFSLMGIVFIYEMFFTKPTPRSNKAAQNASPTPQAQPNVPTAKQPLASGRAPVDEEALFQQRLADTSPLNLAVLTSSTGSAKVSERGNIFANWVPPPEPAPPPPPPPPITLQLIQPQSAIASTPRPLTVAVRGVGFPPDAQIIIEGRPRPTKRVNDTMLSTDLAPQDYSSPRNMTVEVKSQSEPAKLYSNTIPFIVQPPPEPGFKYIGRIGPLGVFEITSSKEVVRAGVGGTVQGVWRIDAISDTAVELTQTQYEIKRRLTLPDKF